MDGRSVNRMEFFSELISCGADLSYWQLDPELKFIESTAPNSDTLYAYFTMSECYDFLKSYVASKTEGPVVLTAAIGLCWIASLEISSGNVCRVHMIGPAFTEEISVENIRHMFYKKKYPETMVREFLEQMNALPLIPLTTWLQYGTMLHYTVSGERVHFSDFNYQVAKRQEDVHSAALGLSGSKTSAWLAEQHAMQMIEEAGKGAVVYMQQEGRGIGLMNKIAAYKLQEEGYDTVDANIHLGFKPDERDYGCGAQMLRHLGIHKMRLMTNNPVKRVGLEAYGLEIVENVPIEVKPNVYNERYLKTKRDRMGHTLHIG